MWLPFWASDSISAEKKTNVWKNIDIQYSKTEVHNSHWIVTWVTGSLTDILWSNQSLDDVLQLSTCPRYDTHGWWDVKNVSPNSLLSMFFVLLLLFFRLMTTVYADWPILLSFRGGGGGGGQNRKKKHKRKEILGPHNGGVGFKKQQTHAHIESYAQTHIFFPTNIHWPE